MHAGIDDWAKQEFRHASLADRRQNTSILRIVTSLARYPDRSFSAAVGHAGRQAAHRIFKHAGSSPEGLTAGHARETARRCEGHRRVLVAQDTTMFVFKGDRPGLARLNGKGARGILGHSALAMTTVGVPLGLLHLELWGEPEDAPFDIDPRKFPEEERESQRWVRTMNAAAAAIPEDVEAIVIQDREGDIFRLFSEPRPKNVQLLVRAAHNREATEAVVEGEEEPVEGKLFDLAASGEAMGTMQVQVPRKSARGDSAAMPERTALLELRAVEMKIQPPAGQRRKRGEQQVWVVSAIEETSEADVTPIKWVLVNTLPVTSTEQAEEVVGYYARRWLIERLHYTLKSGVGAENLMIDDGVSLANAIAIQYVIAWRLLHLTYVARHEPHAPAERVVTSEELTVLQAAAAEEVTTVAQVVEAIARLGGRLPYVKHPPGIKVLWAGWLQLQAMLRGYRLATTKEPLWP